MSHSFVTDTSKVPQTISSSSTTSSTKPNDGLSANAPAFVPRSISTEGHEQQYNRANQGAGVRGRHGRGGLSRALHGDRPPNAHHQQQQQHSKHHGRGGNRHHKPIGQRVQQQSISELRGQQEKQQHDEEPGIADSAMQAAASNTERSANRSTAAGRGRSMAANHLLNFQYDTMRTSRGGRSSSSSRGGGGGGVSSSTARRRYPAPRPQRYDKQKFLQANFRFLVSSTLDRRQFDSDADRMFDWDDVLLVDMMSSTPIQCPISLDSPPSCPQITPCGHVYSFGSIMQHLMNHGGEQLRRSAPCPLCYQPVVARELRLVQVRQVSGVPSVGSNMTFQLLCRPRTSIIPTAVNNTASADDEGMVTATQAAMPATVLTTSNAASSKWKSKAQSAPSSSSATDTSVASQQSQLATALSENLFAKFATCLDPRPLWRASAQQLGQQLALVLSQGGIEAEIEAPALFAAADSLANRARRFAEHQVNQLQQRGVPGSTSCTAVVSSDAGGAGSSNWPVWLKDDAQAAGRDAEQLVRDAFTLALDGSKAALVAKEQQQQVQQRIQQEFPELATASPSMQSAVVPASASSAPPAAVGGGSESRRGHQQLQQQQPMQDSADDASDHQTAELCFDHAFSEDEEAEVQEQQELQQEESSVAAAAVEEDSNSNESVSRATVGRSGGGSISVGPPVLGSSPSASAVLGSSPNTSMMNSASQSGDYYMYQSYDGQWVFLHPLNLRCLLHAHGSYASCPPTVTGKLLEIEDVVQDESSRRRWKFLGHLPLNGTFRLAEVQLLDPALTADQLAPFAEELAAREKRRKRRADAAKRESKREAAAAAAAQKAKQGPTAAELRAMPKLGATRGPSAAGDGVDIGLDLAGLSVEQLNEALAAQAMHDSALVGVASPPAGGVSFAKMTKLGFAASGPALGSNASPGGLSEEASGPVAAAAPAALRGAWGAGNAGTLAAAKLGAQSSGQKSAWGAGSSSAPAQQPASALSKSAWGTGGAGAAGKAASAEGTSSSGTGAANWLVLGGGASGAAAPAAATATGGQEAGSADESGSAPASASKKGKKEKKGLMLFTTGAQRRY